MSERTNEQRAERALRTLQAYKDVENDVGQPDCRCDIVDLLVDLHHYLMECGGDHGVCTADDATAGMARLLQSAVMHFECEEDEDE